MPKMYTYLNNFNIFYNLWPRSRRLGKTLENYADNTTTGCKGKTLEEIKEKLEEDATGILPSGRYQL